MQQINNYTIYCCKKNTGRFNITTNTSNTNKGQQSLNDQPITASDTSRSSSRPIRARKNQRTKPAKIQTAKQTVYDPDTGRNVHPDYLAKGPLFTKEMLDKWEPNLVSAGSQSDFIRSLVMK